MKVTGKRKLLLHTAQSPEEFDIDKNLLEDIDWEKLNEQFKNILI